MKSFYTLLISQWIANIGDVLYIVALIALLYEKTGSALAAASFPMAVTIGMATSGLLFARVLKRFTLGKTLFVTQLLKTVLLGMAIQIESIFVLGFVILIAFFDGFGHPIQTSFIPLLTKNRQQANSLVQGSNQLIQLAMWPIATILITSLSGEISLYISFMLFLVATIVTFAFVRSLPKQMQEQEEPSTISFIDSVRYVRESAFSRMVTSFVTLESFVSTLWISALLLVYLERHLHIDTGWWGMLNATFLSSMIIASIYLYRRVRASSLSFSGLLSIGSMLLFGLTAHITFALIALAIEGYAAQVRVIQLNTAIQEVTPSAQLPYVYSIQQTAYTAAFSIGSLCFGLLADTIPIDIVYLLGALLALPLVFLSRRIDSYQEPVQVP